MQTNKIPDLNLETRFLEKPALLEGALSALFIESAYTLGRSNCSDPCHLTGINLDIITDNLRYPCDLFLHLKKIKQTRSLLFLTGDITTCNSECICTASLTLRIKPTLR